MSSNIPVVNLPNLYVDNLQANWASTTTYSLAAGACLDSLGVNDIVLSTGVTINGAVLGANGLDIGALANSTWYYVYAIGSSFNSSLSAGLISVSASSPTLPSGYDIFRLVGITLTDGSAHFLKSYCSGNGKYRYHMWDANISVLSGGTSASLAAIDVSTAVPPINLTPVQIEVNFTPATANDTASFAPFGSTATLLPNIAGSVAAKVNSGQLKIISKLDTATPKILYINSAASGSTSVWVSGFEYFI